MSGRVLSTTTSSRPAPWSRSHALLDVGAQVGAARPGHLLGCDRWEIGGWEKGIPRGQRIEVPRRSAGAGRLEELVDLGERPLHGQARLEMAAEPDGKTVRLGLVR